MNVTDTSIRPIAGVGFSQDINSFEAGVEIAKKATSDKVIADETLFFLFATPHHKVDRLISGIRSVLGDKPKFLGSTTTGLVTQGFLSYSGALAAGGFISSNKPFFKIFAEENIRDREFEAGKSLAKKIQAANHSTDDAILIFYDSVKTTASEGQPALNLATPILDGFIAQYGYWPTIAGMGAIGEINLSYPCAAWAGNDAKRHFMGASTIFGDIKMDTIILHGTKPLSDYHIVTKSEQNIVYEIDERPALDVIDELLGGTVSWEEFPLLVTLGVNYGDKYEEYNEENYAGRLCLGIDRKQKALIMFETDLVEGTEVQLMQRSINFEYIKPRVNKLMKSIGNRTPVFALYIDCLGRVCGYSGLSEEESLEVIKAVGDTPFLGMFSGVEVANVGNGAAKALDWTGVLCIFSQS